MSEITRVLGTGPEHLYEMSFCNQALAAAGLDIPEPQTLSMLSRTFPSDVAGSMIPVDELPTEVGRFLRQERRQRGISAYRLERLTGIPASTLYHYETGRMGMPEDRAVLIADALGIDADDLLERPVEAVAD